MKLDYFNKDASRLSEKRLFLFDMDGTIYNDNNIFDGTLDTLKYIEDIGGEYVFITNNSSKSVEDYVLKVNKMGIKATKDNFYTSTQATAAYLLDHYSDKKVYASGTKSFIRELKEFGVNVVTEIEDNIVAIVMGYDTELDYQKLIKLTKLINKGLPYIATNPDLVCPVEYGYVPDCGSVAIMLRNATGRDPLYIGKPKPTMIEYVCKEKGFEKEKALVIGDRIYTDIASGLNAGVDTVLVLSGESTLKTLEEDERKPDFVFLNIRTLLNAILDK